MAQELTGFGKLLQNPPTGTPRVIRSDASTFGGGSIFDTSNIFDDLFGLTSAPEVSPIDFEQEQKDIETYIQKLLSIAQGDKDIAIKRLDEEHKKALGTNDTKRASFFEKVADKLEEEIGTIPYDYMIKSERIEEDKTSALQRLDEDEKTLRGELTREAGKARQTQAQTLSERGILSAPRAEVGGLAGAEVGDLETEIQSRFDAIARDVGRGREDIGVTSGRSLVDLKTLARRAGGETRTGFERGQEDVERTLQKQKELLEREKAQELASLELERKAFT
jgi:hypothetical protein